MKKIFAFAAPSMSMLFFAQRVFAECTLNGEVIPCDQMPKWPFTLMIVFFVFMMLMLAFWVWMIIDVAKYEKENTVVWILVVVLAQVVGAIIYYFVRHRKRIKEQKIKASDVTYQQKKEPKIESKDEEKKEIEEEKKKSDSEVNDK